MTSVVGWFNSIRQRFSPVGKKPEGAVPTSSGRKRKSEGSLAGVNPKPGEQRTAQALRGRGTDPRSRRPSKVARQEAARDLDVSLRLASAERTAMSRPVLPAIANVSTRSPFPRVAAATTFPVTATATATGSNSQRRPYVRTWNNGSPQSPINDVRAVGAPPPPRTPTVRWNSGSQTTPGSARVVGTMWRDVRKEGVVGAGVPFGYRFGMSVIPQSSPRSLIKANILTARVPGAASRAGGHRYGDGVSNRNRRANGMSTSARSGRRDERFLDEQPDRFLAPPGGLRGGESSEMSVESEAVVKSDANGGADVAYRKKAEKAAMRGLNDLRLKARVSLEETAQQFRERGREGDRMKALKYVNYARDVQNWGRQAAEEGVREAAATSARKRQEALAVQERRRSAALRATRAAAEALVREAEEAARRREKEEENARIAAEEAAATAALKEKERAAGERRGLTSAQREQVRIAWSGEGASDNDVIVRAFNDLVTQGSMRTLRDGEWLGDEVINVYMKSLQARNRDAVASGKQVPRCGIMSSFFFTQLSDNGRGYRYAGVKRFLKKAKLDLFDLDKFMFPVNVNGNHWTLAVINFRLERLEYYDSLGAPFGDDGFEYMARFVDDESKSKRDGRGMDISHWPRFNYADVPRQRNGLDCGVFASMFANLLSKGKSLAFSQSDIRQCRQVMTLAILRGERSPSDEEALLEDGGGESTLHEWWQPPEGEGEGDGGSMGDFHEEEERQDDMEEDRMEDEKYKDYDNADRMLGGGGVWPRPESSTKERNGWAYASPLEQPQEWQRHEWRQ